MRWIQASEQRAIEVGLSLRPQDELEVSLSHGLAPVEACMLSYRQSSVCQAIEAMTARVWPLRGSRQPSGCWARRT